MNIIKFKSLYNSGEFNVFQWKPVEFKRTQQNLFALWNGIHQNTIKFKGKELIELNGMCYKLAVFNEIQ